MSAATEARSAGLLDVARRTIAASRPRSPHAHVLRGEHGSHLFLPNGSRLFDVAPDLVDEVEAAIATGTVATLLDRLRLAETRYVDDTPLESPAVHALSLAVAQTCNLACSYCYAQQGTFGGAAGSMPLEVAERSVDLLVGGAAPGARLNLAFLGGEPLVNRAVLRAATTRAAELAAKRGASITFSITTNGTLLTEGDAEFFEDHGFAVTISLDGPREAHDALRPFRGGRSSYDVVMRNVAPLLARQQRMQVSARVTVTPRNLMVRRTLDELVAAGFHTVGFSAMLSAPTGEGELQRDDLETLLGEMIDCGHEFERQAHAARRYPFANMVNALREIGRGTHRPYPCGAGAGYLGVSAEGALSACHRFVGDPDGEMGSVFGGVDRGRQIKWLTERHVHRQEPCSGCWARYLCGGGCHHEVIHRGRPACDYIRGWLHYCIEAYLRLADAAGETPAPAPAATGA
jgi:uncharacterized protein